jgi:sortase A
MSKHDISHADDSVKTSNGRLKHFIVGSLIVLIGFCILVYPYASQVWNNYRNVLITQSYSDVVASIPKKDIDVYWEEARAYNATHRVNVMTDVFDLEEEYILSHPYDTLLNPNGDEIMGYIEIPKINLRLAIYHGLGSESLERGIGHIEGTSLPVGGKNTHACLAGHRGLPTGELFTRLDEMELGDIFYLYVLDDILTYEVDNIAVVEPEDSSLTAIQEGRDLVTLITCTPYSINTHRLLVTGHRIPTPEQENIETTVSLATVINDLGWRLLLIIIGASVVIVFGLALILSKGSTDDDDDDSDE